PLSKHPRPHRPLHSFPTRRSSDLHDPTQQDEEVRVLAAEHYAQQIKETADKLLQDKASRGDVKLLSVALRELRYCFKVFAAYRKDRKSTRLNSSHDQISYAVFCLK